MGFFDSFRISASGLTANRLWLDLISNNIANLNSSWTPGNPSGPSYRRQVPVFAELLEKVRVPGSVRFALRSGGVEVRRVVEDNDPPRLVYQPEHPQADKRGYVAYPNINMVNEMVNMLAAVRAYEAGAATLEAGKSLVQTALEIGRG